MTTTVQQRNSSPALRQAVPHSLLARARLARGGPIRYQLTGAGWCFDQPTPDGRNCTICGDTDHQAFECPPATAELALERAFELEEAVELVATDGGDSECVGCGGRFWSGTGHPNLALCAACAHAAPRVFYCAGPSCPGYANKASDFPHPPSCALPRKLHDLRDGVIGGAS